MAYQTVPMRPDHREDVLRLWRENMSDARIADVLSERYRWLYDENPEGAATTVVAIDDAAGEIVGCGSTYPRKLRLGKREILARIPADFAVTRKHRIGGAALGIQRALVGDTDGAYELFFGFPNKGSLPIFQRVGYKVVSAARGWVKPLSAAYKIRQRVGSPWMARLAALPIDTVLSAVDAFRSVGGTPVRTEIVPHADERFDRLWERAGDRYPVTGVRTAAYLNWRYTSFKTAVHHFFCLLDARTGELSAYIVFSVRDEKVFIADVFAIDMERTVDRALLYFARAMRRQGHQSIFLGYAGKSELGDRLKRLGFFPSGDDRRKLVAFVRGLAPDQEQMVFDERNWYMFDGEMDI